MKVLIVGGGIAGLTLAAFLEGSDIHCEIVEKSAKEPEGFLLIMWDNARDILKKLGLSDRFDAEGTPIHAYEMRDGEGNLLRRYDLRDFYVQYGTAMTMVARRDLCHWLRSKVGEEKMREGVTVTGVVDQVNNVQVTFSAGEVREYDAVIGADGVHSTVRGLLFKKNAEEYENWRSWWVWVDRDANAPATVTEYMEAGEVVLVCSGKDRTLAILNAPATHAVWDTPEGRIGRLKEIFKDEPRVARMLTEKKDADAMPSDLAIVDIPEWTKGRVALLGDAAHCYGPHAGLGGSMAMEDAYVLAAELMKGEGTATASEAGVPTGSVGVAEVFKRYEAKRRPRIAAARRLNARMRLGTLIKSKFLRGVVNTVAPYLPERFLIANYNRLLKEEI